MGLPCSFDALLGEKASPISTVHAKTCPDGQVDREHQKPHIVLFVFACFFPVFVGDASTFVGSWKAQPLSTRTHGPRRKPHKAVLGCPSDSAGG